MKRLWIESYYSKHGQSYRINAGAESGKIYVGIRRCASLFGAQDNNAAKE